MELHTLPVISTGHLTPEVVRILVAQGNDNPWVRCATWADGFFIDVAKIDSVLSLGANVPQCLLDIKQWVSDQDLPCTGEGSSWQGNWVRLDRDGEVQVGLPTYL